MAGKDNTPTNRISANNPTKEAFNREESFKKGGKCMKKGGMVEKREARASGGGVFSSAMKGEPRGKTPKPY